ncbi:hypothetical protein M0R04_08615 [Candidatus Dojkabacteria bacterium]|nr:hypothetical protein [Candidatus Dojkabacteria bacterium]
MNDNDYYGDDMDERDIKELKDLIRERKFANDKISCYHLDSLEVKDELKISSEENRL